MECIAEKIINYRNVILIFLQITGIKKVLYLCRKKLSDDNKKIRADYFVESR
jgi:hypothetical protein